MIRERRRFTDVMDEEIDDERKTRINRYGTEGVAGTRRLRHELGKNFVYTVRYLTTRDTSN